MRGQESENKESQQQQPSTPTDQQVLAAQQAAIKRPSKDPSPIKPCRRESKNLNPARSATIFRQTSWGAYRRLQNINMQPEKKQRPKSQIQGTARYKRFSDNPVKQVAQNPLATFSLDVDTGSVYECTPFFSIMGCYSARRCAGGGDSQYFPYDWDIKDKQSIIPTTKPIPFAMRYELAPAPWNEQLTLLKIDILMKIIKVKSYQPNLVFLIDTSGSMILMNVCHLSSLR